ncbi:MAG: hypothetical protein ABUL67_02350, partial [Haliangium ochraceum]
MRTCHDLVAVVVADVSRRSPTSCQLVIYSICDARRCAAASRVHVAQHESSSGACHDQRRMAVAKDGDGSDLSRVPPPETGELDTTSAASMSMRAHTMTEVDGAHAASEPVASARTQTYEASD